MIPTHKGLDFGQALLYAFVSNGQVNIRLIKVEELRPTGVVYLGYVYSYHNLFQTMEDLVKELPNLLPK